MYRIEYSIDTDHKYTVFELEFQYLLPHALKNKFPESVRLRLVIRELEEIQTVGVIDIFSVLFEFSSDSQEHEISVLGEKA